ncbi:phosphatase [Desulfolutivibrio sulfoxidireducens]|uniref:phosphatase domain-containing putative toxin n=1 Tax=Desulfolutivibrio sulfoxidireducens TaxID=2773299 RepID=UPI00159E6E15|nr:phosphatase [Desulfolutivibrio sulfoxidireducens]
MKQPVIPAFFRLLLSVALAALLCIPDAARAKSSTGTDASHPVPVPEASGDSPPVLSFDYSPDMPLPKNFRLADGGSDPKGPGVTIRLSGSSEFDAAGLDRLAAALPGPVVIVDLRQESHGFLNGEPVNWFADKDRGNFGKTPDEAALDEKTRLEALRRAGTALVTTIQSKNKDGGIKKSDADTVAVVSVSSEADLAASLGLGYLRLYVTDDMAPDAVQADRFVDLCRAMAPGTWLHVHCRAGHGRTTTFMVMYALLFNAAGKPLERIAAEQAALGGTDLLGPPKDGWRHDLHVARAAFVREFAAYAGDNPGGAPLSFSQWKAGR